ncbi:MAG: hypothetical protein HY042_02300 [Spirochaetia bacterium]|nr:hypothetical protein [Spirochaetia bacterium]
MLRRVTISLLLITGAFSALQAGDLRLQIGYWPGERTSELEQRFLLDDLTNGGSVNRLDLVPWTGKDTNTVYPLGFTYFLPAAGGRIALSANYIRYQPNYAYTGIGPSPSLSTVTLDNYKTEDWEFEAGYELALMDKKFLITPKVGFRQQFTEFNYNELTVGSGTLRISTDSDFRAQSRSLSVGAGLQVLIAPQIWLVGDYMMASPAFSNWGGTMSDKRTVLGATSGSPFLTIDNATAAYESKLQRWSVGFQYDVTPAAHVQIGVRQEIQTAKYPEYYNLPIIVSSGGAGLSGNAADTVTEFVLDRVFYEQAQKSTKGFVYFALLYDLHV